MRGSRSIPLIIAFRLVVAACLATAIAGAPAPAAARSAIEAQIHRATRSDHELASFYASRAFEPLWSVQGRLRPEAFIVLDLLRNADLEGLDPTRYLQTGIERAIADAASGNPRSLARAEFLLSRTFSDYVRDVRRPRSVGTVYAEPSLRPQPPSTLFVLQRLASEPSLADYLRGIGWMHPIYGQLRSELAKVQRSGASSAKETFLLKANLDRASILPAHQSRYILVDVAAARLEYFQNGALQKTMRVIVGSADHPTPIMIGMVRYATLNPY